MKNTKFIQLFQALNAKESRLFLQYYQQHFHKGNTKAAALLHLVERKAPKWTDAGLENRTIFSTAYPKRSYNPNFLRKQTAYLYEALKQFLIHQRQQANALQQQQVLLTALSARGLSHLFYLEAKPLAKQLDQWPLSDANFLYQHYTLAKQHDATFIQQGERRFDMALQQKSDRLDLYYLAEKLKNSCELLNRSKILEGQYAVQLMDILLPYLQANDWSNTPAIGIYLQIYLSLSEPETETHFEKLVVLLKAKYNEFSPEERFEMFRYAQNYCIRKVNEGHKAYLEQLMKLYQYQLEREINLPKGQLAPADYKNIITVGLQLDKKAWVFDFLHQYKSVLPPEQQGNVFNYNLAIYYYGIQDYDQALNCLRQATFTDIYYEINGKIILLKSYFRQGEYQALYYLADAFKLLLQRNKKIAANYRNAIRNFIIQFKKLAKIKEQAPYQKDEHTQKQILKVQTRIDQLTQLYDREWLQRELNQSRR